MSLSSKDSFGEKDRKDGKSKYQMSNLYSGTMNSKECRNKFYKRGSFLQLLSITFLVGVFPIHGFQSSSQLCRFQIRTHTHVPISNHGKGSIPRAANNIDYMRCRENKCVQIQPNKRSKATTALLSSSAVQQPEDSDIEKVDDPVSLKEDEEFIEAVKEVKDAAINVTESSVKLVTTAVTKGPGIIGRLVSAVASKELRYVP